MHLIKRVLSLATGYEPRLHKKVQERESPESRRQSDTTNEYAIFKVSLDSRSR